MRPLKSLLLLGLLLVPLAWPASALAGGWSVVAADPLPADITADAETSIGFTVLQHGRTPLSGQTPKIEAVHQSGERVTATATAEGAPGHYVAKIRFPKAGAWAWSVDVFEGPHMMPPLTVRAAGAAGPAGDATAQTVAVAARQPAPWLFAQPWVPLAGAVTVVALVTAGLALGWRTRGRLATPTRT